MASTCPHMELLRHYQPLPPNELGTRL
jgi:hypothetical protein